MIGLTRSLMTRPAGLQAVRQFTHKTWVSGPPRTRIPFAEKVVHGVLIGVGVIAMPGWIIVHLTDYRDGKV